MRNYFRRYDIILGWATFAVAAVVYLMTMEPTASLWDCSEFIATSYKLEVGHPPGAPLFMMIARFFTIFAPGADKAAAMVNAMSSLSSALCIMFLFWTITHLGRRIYRKQPAELSHVQTWTVMGAGLIGALAYMFTDTFWFSAIEGEVYALSSLFTAVVFWAILRWEDVADEPHANRWIILIAYLMGLSIGVHILNLLTIPALVFVYYFRKYPKVTWKGVLKATLASGIILIAINNIIIPYTALLGALFDRGFVNGLGLPVNSGLVFFIVALFALLGWLVYYTHARGHSVANTILLCMTVILIGYGSYASVIIRASVNPPMNSNEPKDGYSLYYLLNRDQYGNKPLLTGAQYSAPVADVKYSTKYYIGDDGKYHKGYSVDDYEYPAQFITLFPRMWSNRLESHVEGYKSWGDVKGQKKIIYNGERIEVPTFGENLRYFLSYQLNFMYWRYFLWNFVGRQSDNQSTGQITDGQWLSGIKFIDQMYLGPQDNIPSEMAANKGRNTYYFLPFILGIIGLVFQLNRDPKNFTVVTWLFFMMGIALVLYFNTTPAEPRERDYVYAGSFYAFCIWVGLGVMCVKQWITRLAKRDNMAAPIAATLICSCVPIILGAQNWDDHDRSHRYTARDIGWNYLNSTLPNSIIMNYGDNDTFPLWYNQEVEGVRTDVRVMNMSYLGAGWYVDQMKHRYNDSAPVPFSLPAHKYMYTNDLVYVEDLFERPVELKQVIDFVRSDDPRSQMRLTDKSTMDFIPAKTLLLPVNKENAIASGIVKPQDAHLMVDTIEIKIQKNTIDKPELMLLDLLANFDWKRPLYFTQPSLLTNLGLQDYLQLDGYAYRFVPIKTPARGWNIGRIDTDYLYDKMMNVFRYGNVADPRVYTDTFVQYNFMAAQVRPTLARLANALTDRGQPDKAIEVLDKGLELIPTDQIRYNYQILPYIEAYYKAGAMDKGDAMVEEYADILKEYIDYYMRFPEAKQPLIMNDFQSKVTELNELSYIAGDYGRTEIADEIREYFYN